MVIWFAVRTNLDSRFDPLGEALTTNGHVILCFFFYDIFILSEGSVNTPNFPHPFSNNPPRAVPTLLGQCRSQTPSQFQKITILPTFIRKITILPLGHPGP